jgi:hypothetical protein
MRYLIIIYALCLSALSIRRISHTLGKILGAITLIFFFNAPSFAQSDCYNYRCSPMNPDNSTWNWQNSPMNPDNSPLNPSNLGPFSNHSTYDNNGSQNGYIVPRENGGYNVFDSDGNRTGYNPNE